MNSKNYKMIYQTCTCNFGNPLLALPILPYIFYLSQYEQDKKLQNFLLYIWGGIILSHVLRKNFRLSKKNRFLSSKTEFYFFHHFFHDFSPVRKSQIFRTDRNSKIIKELTQWFFQKSSLRNQYIKSYSCFKNNDFCIF